MPDFDYSREQREAIAFIDMKSFYASCEAVALKKNPLEVSLCVMSKADNSAGLILASSPVFKKVFQKNNVGRAYELPFYIHNRKFNYKNYYQHAPFNLDTNRPDPPDPEYVKYIEYWAKRTIITPPRMSLYIEQNMKIQHIIQNYSSTDDMHWYSIDEGFVNLSSSLSYFYPDSKDENRKMSKAVKLDLLSRDIQRAILKETGIYSTVGMSLGNPLLAKLALDNEAKHTSNMRAMWTYENIPEKIWKIKELTDFWGINTRTEKRLNKLGVQSVYDLAHTNPRILKKEFGVIGVQLFFHANGIDSSSVYEKYQSKSNSLGNSQILPRNYTRKTEIEIVIKEMAEQVAIRMRRKKKQTTTVSLGLGFASDGGEGRTRGIYKQLTVEPTNSTHKLVAAVLTLFQKNYIGGSVRQVAVSYGNLIDDDFKLISLFDTVNTEQIKKENKKEKVDDVVDEIRDRFGFLAIQKATSLSEGSRVVARSKLVGGHSAGGLDGLETKNG
nr:Y-family DNA polymerase [Lactococcus insecticola]